MLEQLNRPWIPSTSFGVRAIGLFAALALGANAISDRDGVASVPPISAESFCVDFMQHAPLGRATATARVATEIGVPEPASPDWVSTLEGRCAAAPDLKLRDFFNHFK